MAVRATVAPAANSITLIIAPVTEERPTLHALDERERGDVVEMDELRLHRGVSEYSHRDIRAAADRSRDRIAIVTPMAVLETDLLREQAYVDGAWVDADSGATFPVIDPATGATIAEVPRMGAAETRRAIEAAQRALPAWKHRTAKDRARVLRRLADLMMERGDDLATLLVREQGKPLLEAKAEIGYAASFYEWFGEEAKRLDGASSRSRCPTGGSSCSRGDRRHCRHHTVELPRRDAHAQVRSRPRRRLHDGAQARRADAAHRARDRRARRGGRRAAGRLLDRHRRRGRCPLDRRRDDLEPARPQARLHRARPRSGSS